MDSQQPGTESRSASVDATSSALIHLLSPRVIAAVSGTVLWLLLVLIATGSGAVTAFWGAMMFLLPLVAICSLTRTISVLTVGRFFVLGGFVLGVTYVGAVLFRLIVPDINAPIRDFVIPPMEEILKLLPVALLLYRRRHAGTWSFGATDVLLMAAAVGAGFGFVEEAYVRAVDRWHTVIAVLPVTRVTSGHMDVGHALWTSIAGGTLGLVVLRSRLRPGLLLGAAGVAWTTLDHVANNYGAVHPGAGATLLRFITGNGWLSLLLFVVVLAGAIAADLLVLHACSPYVREVAAAGSPAGWAMRLHGRALAYTIFKGRHAPDAKRPEALEAALAVLRRMFVDRSDAVAAPEPQAASEGVLS